MIDLGACQECPAIHVNIADDVDGQASRWVEIGAEEEGVPCKKGIVSGTDAVALAYSAAQSSRLGVGVGVAKSKIALHEAHMPTGNPVLIFDLKDDAAEACRLAGCNAGRFVKRMPLRFPEDHTLPERPNGT
jgi:hypothetical protein